MIHENNASLRPSKIVVVAVALVALAFSGCLKKKTLSQKKDDETVSSENIAGQDSSSGPRQIELPPEVPNDLENVKGAPAGGEDKDASANGLKCVRIGTGPESYYPVSIATGLQFRRFGAYFESCKLTISNDAANGLFCYTESGPRPSAYSINSGASLDSFMFNNGECQKAIKFNAANGRYCKSNGSGGSEAALMLVIDNPAEFARFRSLDECKNANPPPP